MTLTAPYLMHVLNPKLSLDCEIILVFIYMHTWIDELQLFHLLNELIEIHLKEI